MKVLHKVVCCVAMGIAAVGALARQATPSSNPPPCFHDQVLQRLPASVEVMVAVNNAARQRGSPAGRAMAEAVFASGRWAGTVRAWEGLARTLEWTPARTFDEVLGKRSSLVLRGLASPDGPEWVVLTAVSSTTQHRLRERLRAAPRSAIAGLAVLSIEDGSFQLLVAPCAAAAAQGLDSSLVLLAPRSSGRLLEEVAPLLAAQAVSESVPTGRDCDIVVSVRPQGSARPALSLTARSVVVGWDASIVCEPSQLFSAGSSALESARLASVWRDSLFRELDAGSLLGVMSIAGMQELPFVPGPLQSWKQVLAGLGSPGEAEASIALRMGVFVRGIGPTPATTVTTASGGSGSGRTRTDREASASEVPRGRLSVTVVAETRKTRETLVEGDALMTRVARLLMEGETDHAAAGGVRFEVPLQGPRAIPLGESANGIPLHPSVEPALTLAFGDEASLTWRMIESRAAGSAAWWVGSLAPTQNWNSRELRILNSAQAVGTGETRRWLSLGSMRPRALARWLEALDMSGLDGPGGGGADSLAAARFIESLQWDAYLREDGQIGATIRIRMAVESPR